ncbi:MAG TPA: AAA family ATPase, partial [Candidatus Didemnitutus sp.]|nr:AAA family ATPase [Candidatus Didemnitutus sp.]
EGVDRKLIERFSKRAQQRNAAVAKEEQRLGRKLTKNEVSHVVHQSRPRKLKNASERDVRAAQLDEIGFFEKRTLRAVVAQARGQKVEVRETVHLGAAMDHGIEHAFSRQSVAPEHELLQAALVKGCGQVELPELKRAFRQSPRLVKVGAEYSTREILGAELAMIAHVNDGLNVTVPIADRFSVSPKLGADQRAALGLVLSSCDRITGIQGLAGAGKTTALKELQRAVVSRGGELVVCAPSAAATDVLRKEGFGRAMTVAKLLGEPGQLSPKSVLVVDEAGTLGTADMLRVFQTAHAAGGARVVLVGDTGQHTPVAQGDALRIIEAHSGFKFGKLTQIRRQRSEQLKETVFLAAKQQTKEAFSRLVAAGEVIEQPDAATLHQKAALAYLRAIREGKTALLVSPTWAEIAGVTDAVRAELRKDSRLAEEEAVRVFDPLGWTDAQKRLADHYEPGLQLRFVRTTKQFKAGETVEVVEPVGKQLRIRGSNGREQLVAPSRAPSAFEVGQQREIAVAAGDLLLLRANAKDFVNGEQVQVKAIKHGQIALVDGRTLPSDYRTFTHGYAVTSQAAQGKTVDEVMVVASSQSFAAVSQESFYVGISRARERARIYTDDAELLGRRVEDSHTRKAAVELQGLREALARAGLKRTVAVVPETRRVVEQIRERWRQFRPLRPDRMSPALHIAAWTRSLREWIGQQLGERQEQRQGLAEQLRQGLQNRTEIVVEQTINAQTQKQSHSRGIRH